MAATPAPARRRRARRGSLERPVNARLYRGAFLVVALPLLLLAFGNVRPGALPAPPLPANFDGGGARSLAAGLAKDYPDRAPGTGGAVGAAAWFRDQMRQYDLPVHSDTWHATVAGLGNVRLENEWAVVTGQSAQAIVVVAHRDDTGSGPGADDDASGTAALVELARGYVSGVRSVHTIVFLSTDGGAFGGVGAARFAARTHLHIVAVVNLEAIAGNGQPRLEIAADTPRSPAAALVETASRRVAEQTGGFAPHHTGVLGQLVDLGFPLTLYDQGPFVARGIPAVTLTTAGTRPPPAFTDRRGELSLTNITRLGRAAQQLVGSLDQGVELTQGTSTYLWAGSRILRGWAVELFLFSLLIPYAVTVIDLFAHCRRRGIALLPAARSLRSRIALWLFVGVVFYALGLVGAWPSGVARPPNPETPVAGDWHMIALIVLALLGGAGWLVTRQRLVPRRAIGADERLAGETAALLGLLVVALLVAATNPFALVFVVPALHAFLWLPHVRARPGPARAVVLLMGLAGPALLVGSLAFRFGLGFDAPWYLIALAGLGVVHLPGVAISLVAAACTAQLVTVAANRYAPYPAAAERPPLGPVRQLVRAAILAVRARRRVTAERRRAFGG
ncbi:MAG TPA: M28 family peptidase [Gaiellaceae bacterium]|nr:M28 family peptidase [Gaiellaceae bacterium]